MDEVFWFAPLYMLAPLNIVIANPTHFTFQIWKENSSISGHWFPFTFYFSSLNYNWMKSEWCFFSLSACAENMMVTFVSQYNNYFTIIGLFDLIWLLLCCKTKMLIYVIELHKIGWISIYINSIIERFECWRELNISCHTDSLTYCQNTM